MGPVLIFDKSVLESLNPDEAVWLDQFFLANITPLFFVETLADLQKNTRYGRTPEDVVGSLAYRTPDLHSKANIHHRTLLEGELAGAEEIEMDGRPCIGGGRYVELGGQTGAYFEASPEEEAMKRWQEHKFLELERFYAKQWREGLSNVDLEEIYSYYQKAFAGHPKPRTLQEVKAMADKFIDNPNQEQILITGLASIGVTPKFQQEILTRWRTAGRPSIRKFAPYFTYVLTIDLVFMFGIGSDLIGRGRPSHKIDIAYLYYLPFCKIFTSNDKLHKAFAPLFLGPDQSFISGKEFYDKIRELEKRAKTEGTTQPSRPGESDQIVIKRMVSGKRGKWTRFPPEVMNRRKNADGNWEDVPI